MSAPVVWLFKRFDPGTNAGVVNSQHLSDRITFFHAHFNPSASSSFNPKYEAPKGLKGAGIIRGYLSSVSLITLFPTFY